MPSKQRLKFLFLIFIAGWVFIVIKLFRIQVLDHERYENRAYEQYKKQIPLPARRGLIRDRNAEKLAYNERYYRVYLELPGFRSRPDSIRLELADLVASSLMQSKETIRARIRAGFNGGRHTILIAPNVSEDRFQQLKTTLQNAGFLSNENRNALYGDPVFHRTYGNIAHNLVGFVDSDNRGIAGIEKQLNDVLQGQDGYKIVQQDALGRTFSRTDYEVQSAIHGNHVTLTIDRYHQEVLESELKHSHQLYRAKTVSGIIMDPNSGEILAMASYPTFDANNPGRFDGELHGSNRVVIDTFEPGSTFKIVTAAAALEERIKYPDDRIFCENGRFRYGPKTYRDDDHKFGWLTFREVIEKSSNIGVIKIALEIGNESFYRYVRDFGFGNRTGIEFDGESGGVLRRPDQWSKLSLPSMAFGHEISVTALQLAQAYAVVANGGVLMRPVLVREVRTADGRVLRQKAPEAIRRVMSKSTADTLTSFLKSVVTRGTGSNLKSTFAIAGKTGTAQVYDVERRTYESGKVVASFAGFFPADQPKYVMVIVVNEPRYKHLNYGGWTAGPAFRRIAMNLIGSESLADADEYQELQVDTNLVYIPDLTGLSRAEATAFLSERELPFRISGDGSHVIAQNPKAGQLESRFFKEVELIADSEKAAVMPDVRRLTLREALRKLKRFHVKIEVRGSGLVKSQSVRAGRIVPKNATVVLTCG